MAEENYVRLGDVLDEAGADVDLVATFDEAGELVEVDLSDPKWNYWERVNRLSNLHHISQAEAADVVRTVIAEKEHDPGVSVTFVTRSREPEKGASLLSEADDF